VIADDLQPLAQPISELTPLPVNPRVGNVEAVMRSYNTFGQRKPIVARRDGTVIAGNHQLEAAKRLGWSEIAVVFVDDDDTTAEAFALADNRIGDLGGYDNGALSEMLARVQINEELLQATGYTSEDLSKLLKDINANDLDSNDLLSDPMEFGERYEVIIECENEFQQTMLLERLSLEGLKVKAIVI